MKSRLSTLESLEIDTESRLMQKLKVSYFNSPGPLLDLVCEPFALLCSRFQHLTNKSHLAINEFILIE